jgi:hypothetical protein
MAERYKDVVPFVLVYVREAHPTDGWQVRENVADGVLVATARTQQEKDEHADLCVVKLDIKFPTVVDAMDNRIELAYAGWPDRLYLIGKDGRVAFKGAIGPQGFRPSELEAAITNIVK